MATLKLYLVTVPLIDTDLSVFAWAENPKQAAAHWSDHYTGWDCPTDELEVWDVPTVGVAGAVAWQYMTCTSVPMPPR